LWFNEALAQLISGQGITESEKHYLSNCAVSNILIPFNELKTHFPQQIQLLRLAYLQSYDFLNYLLQVHGEENLRSFFSLLSELRDFESAFVKIFGKNVKEKEIEWINHLSKKHSFWLQLLSQITLWELLALLAIVAFIRYMVKSRKIKKRLEEEEKLYNHF
ncbi:MAG: hypothetical protein ABIH42_06050, partial [Planctomycetota bacterium]